MFLNDDCQSCVAIELWDCIRVTCSQNTLSRYLTTVSEHNNNHQRPFACGNAHYGAIRQQSSTILMSPITQLFFTNSCCRGAPNRIMMYAEIAACPDSPLKDTHSNSTVNAISRMGSDFSVFWLNTKIAILTELLAFLFWRRRRWRPLDAGCSMTTPWPATWTRTACPEKNG